MSEKKVSEKRIRELAGKLQDKKGAELKLEEEKAWCGNEPHELPGTLPETPLDPRVVGRTRKGRG